MKKRGLLRGLWMKKRGPLMKKRGLLMKKSGLFMMQKAPRGPFGIQKAPRGPFDDVLYGEGPLKNTNFELLASKKGVWNAGPFVDTKYRKK